MYKLQTASYSKSPAHTAQIKTGVEPDFTAKFISFNSADSIAAPKL